jgi:hypothetical protein
MNRSSQKESHKNIISVMGVKLPFFDPDSSGSKNGWHNLPITDMLLIRLDFSSDFE